MKSTIETSELKQILSLDELIILDCTIPKVTATKDQSKTKQVIPGALFLDLKKKFSKQASQFPNTIPSKEQFEAECRKLGINKDSRVIVYDDLGIYSSPRAWWLFKVFGFDNVQVLNGGLPEWIGSNLSTVDSYSAVSTEGNFEVKFNPDYVFLYEQIKQNSISKDFCILDARSEGRFNATAPDPRPDLESGNIPNSINLPYSKVLDGNKMKSVKELLLIFEELNLNDKELIFSCGSGITACIILLAHHICFKSELNVYDGSWTEWATLSGLTK